MNAFAIIAGMLLWAGGVSGVPAHDRAVAQQAEAADREALDRTRAAMGEAFRNGDVAGVMAYHHPQVSKALAYGRPLIGADAVAAELREGFGYARIEFIEDHVEDLAFHGDIAVQVAHFAVRVTPRSGGPSQIHRGRSQVVWVRYAGSPTGWAAWREMVQPGP